MTILSPSSLETSDYHSDGWNAVNNSNWQKINGVWQNILNGGLILKPASQAEAEFTNLDDAKSKIFLNFFPIVSFLSGSVSLDLSNLISPTKLVGDQRELAGAIWIHGHLVRSAKTSAGTGTVSLSSTGNDITITCATTDVDLTGWENGDKVVIVDTAGAASEYTIDSIAGTTITLTTAAPTVNGEGASISLVPNRTITSGLVINSYIHFVGFYFKGITDDNAMQIGLKATLENCLFYDVKTAVKMDPDGILETVGNDVTIIDCDYGFVASHGSSCYPKNTTVAKATIGFLGHVGGAIDAQGSCCVFSDRGFCAWHNGAIHCDNAIATKITNEGFGADGASSVRCFNATARYCNIGYKYTRCSFVDAYNCSANSFGNSNNTQGDAKSDIYYS